MRERQEFFQVVALFGRLKLHFSRHGHVATHTTHTREKKQTSSIINSIKTNAKKHTRHTSTQSFQLRSQETVRPQKPKQHTEIKKKITTERIRCKWETRRNERSSATGNAKIILLKELLTGTPDKTSTNSAKKISWLTASQDETYRN